MEKMTTSNISKLDVAKKDDIMDSNKSNEIVVEHILLSNTVNNFVQNETKSDLHLKMKLLLRNVVKEKGKLNTVPSVDPKTVPLNTEIITRSTDPINEFKRNDQLFLDSFPLLFLLGEGWYKTGSAKKNFILHLLRQYDHRFGRDQRLQ